MINQATQTADQPTPTLSIQSLELTRNSQLRYSYKSPREKTINDIAFFRRRKEHPINIYFRSEESRRKHDFQKNCKPWYYYMDHENTFVYGKPSRQFIKDTSLPSVHRSLETYSDLFPHLAGNDKKRVAFQSTRDKRFKEKLPEIAVSRTTTPLPLTERNKYGHVSDVTLEFNRSVKDDNSLDLNDLDAMDGNEEVINETEVYTISFRQDNRGDYDPQSELHSDYYTLKKIETIRKRPRPQKVVTIPDHRKNFKAVVCGNQKHLHKKFHIECEGFHSVPLLREWFHHQREEAGKRQVLPAARTEVFCHTDRSRK